jgi:hypothetical protein
MTEFDPLKAAQEILAAMTETRGVLVQMEQELVETHSSAEQRLNHVRKVIGAMDAMLIGPQRAKVAQLQEQSK